MSRAAERTTPKLTDQQLALFLRWLYRRVRNNEIMRAFAHDIATNHLPHIYERLERLREEQGIERSPLPPIR